ncbi:MAG: TetR/AcrR family transcriptional regulator [Lachnospiraceae bacterium]|nr:TetR/AcrR family transcriptional regulator [Lachnospiraceae bacterium]
MSPRSKEAFEAMRKTTKQKIENAALSLIARKGTSITIDEIAKNAEISKGLLYNHYASKEALIEELTRQTTFITGKTIGSIVEESGSAAEKIQKITSIVTDIFSGDYRGIENFMFIAQIEISGFLADKPIYDLPEAPNPLESLTKIIIAGQQEGTVVLGVPVQLAMTYWATIQGLSSYIIMGVPVVPSPEMLLRILLKENHLYD